MKFVQTNIKDLIVVEPKVFADQRGCFFENYNKKVFGLNGIDTNFVQDNHSESTKNVLRGLHCQLGEYAQAKLVRVLHGEILDVAVDARVGSSSFGKWFSIKLSAENKKQLFIPRGFLHGFLVLSQSCVVNYKCDNAYKKEAECTVIWNDLAIGIDWQLGAQNLIVSDKDKQGVGFKDAFDYRG